MSPGRSNWFPQFHAHSEHSLKDGCSPLEAYVERVKDLGGDLLVSTEHGQASGWARGYFACKKAGIRYAPGLEAYVNADRLKPARDILARARLLKKRKRAGAEAAVARAEAFLRNRFRPSRHLILVARNREGYRNLVRISTDSWMRGFYYFPRTSVDFLEGHAEGLVCSTACIGGHVPTLYRNDPAAGVAEARRLQRIFGPENFYVELMATEYVKQRETNLAMLRLATEVGAPTIVTCDVHYLRPEDQLAQRCLLLMRDKKTIDQQEAGEGGWQFESKDLYWKSLEDVARVWSEHHSDYWPREEFRRSVRNTLALADRIEGLDFDCSLKLPGVFERPEATLRSLVAAGLRDRLARSDVPAPGHSTAEYAARVRREIGVVEAKGFAEYFLVLEDVCRHARSVGAIQGPGRGSAAGCLLAYMLRITDVDPIRFGLLFERFLDVNRSDPPDIDLDFSPQHREQIKAYISRRFPATATIGTLSTFKPRATIRDVGRTFGIPQKDLLRITKPLEGDADKLDWEQVFELWPEVRAFAEAHPEAWRVVKTLRGLAAHRGKNAAGVLIAPAAALDDLPLMKDPDGTVVTAYPDSQGDGVRHEGRDLTRLGFLKLDVLGLDALNVVPRALEILRRDGVDAPRAPEAVPIDDPEALAVASTGDVPGVFQFDTPVSRQLLRKIRVDSFDDLSAITSLVRPGPLKSKLPERFARLKRGDAWKRSTPEVLHGPLARSRGMMIYQEDVMATLSLLGGFTYAEANSVRKIVSKKLDPKLLAEWKGKFVEGGRGLGHDPKMLAETFDSLYSYAEYAFGAAHAYAYAQTSARQLWVLARYPGAYFASLLAETDRGKSTSVPGQEDVVTFVRAALARGVRVLPPDALSSSVDFDLVDGAIPYGLGKVKGVASAAEAIVEARARCLEAVPGVEPTFEDLLLACDRRRANARAWTALVLAGAFDRVKLAISDEVLTEAGAAAVMEACHEVSDPIERRNALLVAHAWATKRTRTKPPPEPETYLAGQLRERERELLGLALSWWASKGPTEARRRGGLSTIRDALAADRATLAVLGEVARVHEHRTGRGTMAFLTIADETATLENVTVFAEGLRAHGELLRRGKLVVLRLRRRENRNERYGRWSYLLDERSSNPVESATARARG